MGHKFSQFSKSPVTRKEQRPNLLFGAAAPSECISADSGEDMDHRVKNRHHGDMYG